MISGIKPSLPSLSYDILHQKYVIEGLGTGQIAKQFASSKNRIRDALIKYGIPLESKRHRFNKTNIPFGKKLNSEGGLDDCSKEQRAIEIILKLKSKGLSNRKICEELQSRKIRIKTGKEVWHPESLRQMLKRIQEG
ncbi:MAG: recombinase family protein [Bacteriovoracaceae bacterium]|jgi:hypothetical protein|nr:recombinase family protein [Bacteriovoracaceae bacterium]